eukprot:1153509-Pelagomonas_calceolata.AAC.1
MALNQSSGRNIHQLAKQHKKRDTIPSRWETSLAQRPHSHYSTAPATFAVEGERQQPMQQQQQQQQQHTWSMVWLAPVSRSSPGRSAVTSSRGTPDSDASTTAGSRLATAVPELQTKRKEASLFRREGRDRVQDT